ncbi:receptor-like protein EIX2 [Jatropha curcas]|uniref:receptor-like protein EIX2 n=1 Tax=Jatropha curcas TaxID=180498 RepID=UPI0018959AE0|nr:receptor-like protein EIX2 [Jatropha curcas]
MNGTIPESFGQLSNLVNLDLEDNSWEGVLDETHLMNLTSLENIHLTTDSTRLLVFNVSYDWIPPFTLKYIQLVNCKVGPFFPKWLEVQTQLIQKFIDLSYNALEGLIPLWTTNATELYLQSNSFSGPIPENIAVLMSRLQNLHLSDNHLNGTIPSSICKLEELRVFAVRSNGFRGELIDCWSNLQSLFIVEASNNHLSGSIPKSLGYAKSLTMLSLSNNNLDGEIPFSLQNCSLLSSINLGGNRLSGNIPSWIGLNLSNILVLRLRANLLDGQIPEEICNLPYLHFLDISKNKLSGTIPSCLSNLTALVYGNSTHNEYQSALRRLAYFKEQISVITKGREYEFSSNIALLNAIDLSENNLRGKIPEEIVKN